MPNYDVECSSCQFQDTLSIKLAELDAWDLTATCPSCKANAALFHRVIRHAPAGFGGAKSQAKTLSSHKSPQRERFVSSGARDDMRHQQEKRSNPDQIAAARDSVRRGEFEGF